MQKMPEFRNDYLVDLNKIKAISVVRTCYFFSRLGQYFLRYLAHRGAIIARFTLDILIRFGLTHALIDQHALSAIDDLARLQILAQFLGFAQGVLLFVKARQRHTDRRGEIRSFTGLIR